VREIAAACEFSPSATQNALDHLKARGWIAWTEGKSRTIRLTPRAPDAFHLPDSIKARLEAHCARTGDDPFAVICDAIDLHIDQAESEFPLSQ
jgi:SOS-response transcriptional repressor LexA